MPGLDQACVEFDSRHAGHMDVRDQAGGLVETARCEKIGCRWESLDRVTQRAHESPHGLANEFIVLDNRNQWRFGQSALRHSREAPTMREGCHASMRGPLVREEGRHGKHEAAKL